ncbi:MAG: hydantoinase/oxoprolinase N-terminal domain-containing protein [Acidimicrobiales bacterium]
MRCGVDTGGTFTDVVGDDGRIAKVLSNPDDPGRAVADGVADLVLVMSSAGGLLPAEDAAELPVALLLSGPAGG